MQVFLRKWINENLQEEADRCEESGKAPSNETQLKMGKVGFMAAKFGPNKYLIPICKSLNITLPGGVDPKEFN